MFTLTVFITISLFVGHTLSDCVTTTSEDDTVLECARGCRCPSKYSSCSMKLTWTGRMSDRRGSSETSLCECKTCTPDREPDERPTNGGRPVYKCTREVIENMSEQRCSRYCVCEDARNCRGQYKWSSDGRGGSRCECEMCRTVDRPRGPFATVLEQR